MLVFINGLKDILPIGPLLKILSHQLPRSQVQYQDILKYHIGEMNIFVKEYLNKTNSGFSPSLLSKLVQTYRSAKFM